MISHIFTLYYGIEFSISSLQFNKILEAHLGGDWWSKNKVQFSRRREGEIYSDHSAILAISSFAPRIGDEEWETDFTLNGTDTKAWDEGIQMKCAECGLEYEQPRFHMMPVDDNNWYRLYYGIGKHWECMSMESLNAKWAKEGSPVRLYKVQDYPLDFYYLGIEDSKTNNILQVLRTSTEIPEWNRELQEVCKELGLPWRPPNFLIEDYYE